MYSKLFSLTNEIVHLENVLQDVFDRLYSSEMKRMAWGPPQHLERFSAHYSLWLKNIQALKNYNSASLPNIHRWIFKIFVDAPEAEAVKFLTELQAIFQKREIFMLLAMIFHDIGKIIQDPQHSEISFAKFQELCANDFQELAGTEIYPYLQEMDAESRYVMGLLIKYHTIGSITYDGNLGMVQQLREDYTHVSELPWEEFLDMLICFAALDKASVANDARNGFLSWYDIGRLHRMLKYGYRVNSLNVWADMVTNQFIMNHTYKQEAYDFYYPQFQHIAYRWFSDREEQFLSRINASLRQAVDMGYVNNHLIRFAWENEDILDLALDTKQQKNFRADIDVLSKFFMIKTAMTFFYKQEEADMVKVTFYRHAKNEKSIFAFEDYAEIYGAMLDSLETGRATRILRPIE